MSDYKMCPKCRKYTKIHNRICPYCGNYFEKYSLTSKSQSRSVWTSILIFAIIFVVIVFVVISVLNFGKDESTENPRYTRPFVSVMENSGDLKKGDTYLLQGSATGNPGFIYIWIFEPNKKIIYEKVPVSVDNTFKFELLPGQTQRLESGEYYVLIQHPMENKIPDVYLSDGKISKIITGNEEITHINDLRYNETAYVVARLINDPQIDDTYMGLTFIVE